MPDRGDNLPGQQNFPTPGSSVVCSVYPMYVTTHCLSHLLSLGVNDDGLRSHGAPGASTKQGGLLGQHLPRPAGIDVSALYFGKFYGKKDNLTINYYRIFTERFCIPNFYCLFI